MSNNSFSSLLEEDVIDVDSLNTQALNKKYTSGKKIIINIKKPVKPIKEVKEEKEVKEVKELKEAKDEMDKNTQLDMEIENGQRVKTPRNSQRTQRTQRIQEYDKNENPDHYRMMSQRNSFTERRIQRNLEIINIVFTDGVAYNINGIQRPPRIVNKAKESYLVLTHERELFDVSIQYKEGKCAVVFTSKKLAYPVDNYLQTLTENHWIDQFMVDCNTNSDIFMDPIGYISLFEEIDKIFIK